MGLGWLLPPACAGCGGYGSILCSRCRNRLRPPTREDDLFLAADAGTVTGDALIVAVAAFAHEGVTRHAIGRLKYAQARAVASALAAAALPALERVRRLSGPATLVPVPVHRTRLDQRGFNQAALLANHLARRSGLPVATPLVRVNPTERQHRLDRDARLRNLADAFQVVGRRPPPTVIVVDDILTTSATLEACARALRQAGTESVYGFCIAREV